MLRPVDMIRLIFEDKGEIINIYPNDLNNLEIELFRTGVDEVEIDCSDKTIIYKRDINKAHIDYETIVRELSYKRITYY